MTLMDRDAAGHTETESSSHTYQQHVTKVRKNRTGVRGELQREEMVMCFLLDPQCFSQRLIGNVLESGARIEGGLSL